MTSEQPKIHNSYGFQLETLQPQLKFPIYERLFIILNKNPTLLHYDPETIILPTIKNQEQIERLSLSLSNSAKQAILAPGTIRLQDRKGKSIAFFSFGGQVTLYPENDQSNSIIIGSQDATPILNPQNILQQQLIEMAQIFLARKSASYLCAHSQNISRGEKAFQEWLLNNTGLPLYQQVLANVDLSIDPQLRPFIKQEVKRLKLS